MDGYGFINGVPKFQKEAPIPNALVRGIGHGHVLSLSGVLSHSLLLSRGPAYSTVCKQKYITGGGVAVISLVAQTGIRIAVKAFSVGAIVAQARIHRSCEIG